MVGSGNDGIHEVVITMLIKEPISADEAAAAM
jgi:hypothetical protein